MKKCFFIFLLFFTFSVKSEQFIYPVAEFDHGNQVAVIHQKSLQDIEVWFINQEKQTTIKGLSSFLTPANLRMIPSGKGFSFIDQGYIKIKYFEKRSAKTLEIYEPISLFSSVNWIDEHTFYFTAQHGDFYHLFCCDDEANKIQRLSCESIDFLYPQKIGDLFFCIKRTIEGQFKITQQPWQPISFNEHQILSENVIVPETLQQLCFLRMISNTEGFYLSAPSTKRSKKDELYDFTCYHLLKSDDCFCDASSRPLQGDNEKDDRQGQWKTEELFSFQIQSKYIHGDYRLYESIEPFLPKYSLQDYVYFSTYNKNKESFEMIAFHIPTKKNIKLEVNSLDDNQYKFFAPYIFKEKMYGGVIIKDTEIVDFTQKNLLINLLSIDTNIKVLT